MRGFFVAAGFCAHGIAGAGGIGQQMAQWIVEGEPELDLWKMDIRRFGGAVPIPRYTLARTDRGLRHLLRHPLPQRGAAGRAAAATLAGLRGARRRSAPSSARRAAGSGRTGSRRTRLPATSALRPRGWAGQHWSPAIGAEALATRNAAALFDESSFAKLEVDRAAAPSRFLEHLCANEMDRPVGAITYTQMLNSRGGIEADFTVTRLGEERFLIVTGTAFGNHDLAGSRGTAPADGSVERPGRHVVSSVLRPLGSPCARHSRAAHERRPRERRLPVPDRARDHRRPRALPCAARDVRRRARLGALSTGRVRPRPVARDLGRGPPHGLVAGGYRAIEALRLEKGYRVWSSDITPEETPDEAGLAFAVKADKPGGFLGRDALVERRTRPPAKRLRCLVLDDPLAVVPRQRAGAARRGDLRPRHLWRLWIRRRAQHRLRLPARPNARSRERGWRSTSSASGSGRAVEREPLYDPSGERIRA